MEIKQNIQDSFLERLCSQEIKVSIYLVNGIRLEGHIQSFDQYVLSLRGTPYSIIYKQAICSIVPLRALEKTED